MCQKCYSLWHETEPSREESVGSTGLLGELEAAQALLCSARETLKMESDSSDYHRISLLIERLCSMIARRSHSPSDQGQARPAGPLPAPTGSAFSDEQPTKKDQHK